MSLPREFIFNKELSKLDAQLLGSSAPPTSTAPVSCSIEMAADPITEVLSPDKAGSLLSIQSAPPEQSERSEPRERPVTLLLELPLATQVGAYLSAMSPTDQEEDSLLTLSSVTARPLLAASRKLRPHSDSADLSPPDGGYGWVVVFGAFMVQFWVAGLFKSYGVLYVEIMETFPDSSESVASWIPAALSTLCLALAPLSSALCEKYSCRLVVFAGGLCCGAGLALSYFSNGLLHLLLSFGVLTGIGGGLSTTPGIVIVSQYFDKHRALANGICVSGTAVGSFVFPMLIEKLVGTYGFHGTVLLLGAGMLHVCVSATLYRAPPAPRPASPTVTTTTTENTTLLNDIQEGKTAVFNSMDNKLQNLFQPETELTLTLNQKNNILSEEKRANLLSEIIHPSLIEVTSRPLQSQMSDSEDSEGLDVLGVVGLPRDVVKLRLRPTRSSSILHSVEDLSTDSTCVYKARGRILSRSLYIKPPLPNRIIQSKLSEPVSIKKEEEELKEETVEVKEEKRGCVVTISRYLDVSLLKSWRFGLLCASVALMSCGSPYALYYLPAYTVAAGHSKAAAGHLVAISAILDLCGRLGLGWLCDLHLFCRRKAYIVSILVAGAAVLTLPSLTSWWSLAIASGAYGLCLGCWFLLVPVLLADAFGTARIASSYGLVRMFQSLAAVSVPPTAGLLRDVTGGYSWCFYGMGSCMVLGSIPVLAFHLSTKNEDNESLSPPDGGYGWVVVFGAFMVQFWVAGLFKSYGVLYVEIMETFPDSSESVASWIPAALSTLCLALAPLSSALCEKYSCRLVVFAGGLCCGAGLALSYFSNGLLHLLLSFGVLTGIGGGLSTTPGIVIVSQYFDKHRALANGICVSGTAVGSFVFPMLIEKLVGTYGFHGTVLLLGAGMLHVCVSATLYRAPPAPRPASPTVTTTTTENTTLLNDIQEGKTAVFNSMDNKLQNLFQPETELTLTLNQKNNILSEEKRANLLSEIIHPSLIEVTSRPLQSQMSDSEDSEGLDVLGVVGLPRYVVKLRLRPTRSSSILHSVEDLSTDSTCVYKARGRILSRSLYIKPPLPNRIIQSKLSEPVSIKKEEEELKEETVEVKEEKRGCVVTISRYLDVSLLKSWRFGLLCASVALMSCGSPYALYYLPAYTVAAGHSKAAAGHLVAISAILDLCGRLGLGWLCDLHLFCRRKAYIVSILVAGAAVLTLPSLTSWWSLAIASGAYGLCLGCWFLLVPVLLADAFGTARIASSYGLVRMFQSLAAVSVPPTAGLLRDVTGGYSWCFYGMGSCMVLGSIPVLAFHLSTKNEDNESLSPPDGGYGWVVVFGAFMVQFWVAGLFKSYGVLYVEIMETFPDSSESVASWIPAALSTLCLALAPLSSALCEKYSCRLVVFAGGLCCGAGLALSYFSNGLLHLLLSFGVLTGIGGGLSTTPGIVIVSQYFDKHRALANGICVSGTAVGSFVFPMLIEKLVGTYGFHGTVLLLGAGMLHVCVSATLYRAPPAPRPASPTVTTTTTENTTLLNDIQEGKTAVFNSMDNKLQNLFQPETELTLTLNQKNNILSEEKRANLLSEIIHPSLIEVTSRPLQSQMSDSEDSEGLDVLGVVGLPRDVVKLRLRPTRSSSILHSVEDLSTDSTCVNKARGRILSRSLYIKPPLPNRIIQSKLSEPVSIKKEEEELKEETVEVKEEKRGCVVTISRYLDVSLLKSWRFGLLCASVALMSCGSPYALYYLPAYTVAAGHSKAAAGHLVAISAILDLCGRLGLGWLCDLHLFCRRKAYIVSILVAGAAVLTLPSLTSWWSLAIASGAYGLCLGCWFLLVPVLLADAFGTARIASSYGLVRMFQSLAAVSVPPTAGLLRDVTGGYSWCFYGMGSCMVLGSIPVLAFHLSTKIEDNESSVD